MTSVFYEIRSRKDDSVLAVLPATNIVIAKGNVKTALEGITREAECFLLPTGQALPTDLFFAEPHKGLPARFKKESP